jgi:hypothetical protein
MPFQHVLAKPFTLNFGPPVPYRKLLSVARRAPTTSTKARISLFPRLLRPRQTLPNLAMQNLRKARRFRDISHPLEKLTAERLDSGSDPLELFSQRNLLLSPLLLLLLLHTENRRPLRVPPNVHLRVLLKLLAITLELVRDPSLERVVRRRLKQ